MWVDLLLVQLSYVRQGFPLSLKTNISKFQFDFEFQFFIIDEEPLGGCATFNIIIIYLSILFTTCLVMQC